MDWSELFLPVADYLNFMLDLLAFEIPDRLVQVGRIDGTLLLYFSLSIALATAIQRRSKVPNFMEDPEPAKPKPTRKHTLDGQEMLAYMPVIIAGGIGAHLGLVAWAEVAGHEIGNYRDTVNATFLASCVNYPLGAILGRGYRVLDDDNPRQLWSLLVATLLALGVMLAYTGIATAEVHALPWSAAWIPFGLWMVMLVGLGVAFHLIRRFLRTPPNAAAGGETPTAAAAT